MNALRSGIIIYGGIKTLQSIDVFIHMGIFSSYTYKNIIKRKRVNFREQLRYWASDVYLSDVMEEYHKNEKYKVMTDSLVIKEMRLLEWYNIDLGELFRDEREE